MGLIVCINQNTGEEVRFNNRWGSKVFTDDEIQKLANGEVITFPYTTQNGNYFSNFSGKLLENITDSSGNKIYKFEPSFAYDCPPGYCGVFFTEDEKNILINGGSITRDDFMSQTSNSTFTATIRLDKSGNRPKIVPAKIKVDFKSVENTMNNNSVNQNTNKVQTDPFVNALYKMSQEINHTSDVVNNKLKELCPYGPSLTDGKIDISNIRFIKALIVEDPNTIELLYSLGVKVYISITDYNENKDIIPFLSVSDIIKTYAISVDTSELKDYNVKIKDDDF